MLQLGTRLYTVKKYVNATVKDKTLQMKNESAGKESINVEKYKTGTDYCSTFEK